LKTTLGKAALLGGCFAVFTLTGCAQVVWDRPATTQAEFSMDAARCNMFSKQAAPGGVIAYGSPRFVAAASLLSELGTAVQQQSFYQDCMQANGYIARATQ